MKFNTKEKLQIKRAEACAELVKARAVYDEAEANLLRAKERHLRAHKAIDTIDSKLRKIDRLPDPVDHKLAPKGYRAELDIGRCGCDRCDVRGRCDDAVALGVPCTASRRPDKQSVIFVKIGGV